MKSAIRESLAHLSAGLLAIPTALLLVVLVTGCYKDIPAPEINKVCQSQMDEVTKKFGEPVAKNFTAEGFGSAVVWFYHPVSNSTAWITIRFRVPHETADGTVNGPPVCEID